MPITCLIVDFLEAHAVQARTKPFGRALLDFCILRGDVLMDTNPNPLNGFRHDVERLLQPQ